MGTRDTPVLYSARGQLLAAVPEVQPLQLCMQVCDVHIH